VRYPKRILEFPLKKAPKDANEAFKELYPQIELTDEVRVDRRPRPTLDP
jgi:hypothetical protein